MPIETVKYTVKKDDNLWNIVKSQGFPPKDWKKILAAPYNSDLQQKLKKQKREPDKIFPGEVIYLPAYNI
jgi:nucleoid-associated protein YgaU